MDSSALSTSVGFTVVSSGNVSLEDSSSWFEVNNATNGGKSLRLEMTKTFFPTLRLTVARTSLRLRAANEGGNFLRILLYAGRF